jgi:hypothetical protein
MKINSKNQRGSILMITMLTITILMMLCVTSLYITGQNGNAGMQAASWQQALSGAESAVDQAIAALNTGTWTNWVTISGSVPNLQPSPGPTPTAASGAPASGQYNYLASSISSQVAQYNVNGAITATSEGKNLVSTWTTIDPAIDPDGLPLESNGHPWYRIRATGTAAAVGPPRVSNQKLDNDLRKIGLRFDRKTNTAITTPQATRTIEVIVQAVAQSIWVRGITLRNTITMSGGGVIDSFDSGDPFKSTGGQYDIAKRQSHGDVATTNSGNSNLNNTYVYGSLAYSGSAVKNTNNVQGTISTPFNATIPATSDPGWSSGSWDSSVTQVTSTATLVASGTQSNPTRYKLSQINISGGNVLTLTGNGYMEIWVTGKLTTSGSGYITQDTGTHVMYYVDNDINLSGSSYLNQSGYAANVSIIGVGTGHKVTVSGSAAFVGVIDAPGSDVTISGGGGLNGALIGNSLNISGGAGLHYDEALNKTPGSTAIGNYAFASWFEDTR